MEEKGSYTFEDFENIVRELREKCPWDSTQTHKSLCTCLKDETREVLEAIEQLEATGEGGNLCEELGDLLLSIVLQAVIAQEEGLFTMEDVLTGISKKMIFRHPRIFAPENKELSSLSWDELKQREKSARKQ